jgi:hypothetical protein
MIIKSKPVAPKRKKKVKYEVDLGYSLSLSAIRKECVAYMLRRGYTEEELAKHLSDDIIEIVADSSYYDSIYVNAEFALPESDAEFSARKRRYEVKLQAYNKWYADYKKEIEAEIERRRAEAVRAEAEKIQKEVDRLSKALAANHKKLQNLDIA